MRAAPTASLQLPHIVTGEPPGLAVAGPFPPAPVILSDHSDDVALGEGELVLIGLLESKARLEQRVATPTALGHVLRERRGMKTELNESVLDDVGKILNVLFQYESNMITKVSQL